MTSILGEAILGEFVLAGIDSGATTTDIEVTDSISFSETIGLEKTSNITVSDTLTFTDLAAVFGNEHLYDALTFGESISVAKVLNIEITDTLTFDDEVHTVIEGLDVVDTLDFTEDITLNRVYNRTKNDILHFTETIGLAKTKGYSSSDILAFDEHIGVIHVKHLTVTDAVTFAEHIAGEVFLRTVTDTLTFSETRTVRRVKHLTVSDTLEFQDQITRTGTVNLTVSDTLSFIEGGFKKANIGNLDAVTIPGIQVIKVRNCQVVLQGEGLTIILPCPEFGDTESSLAEQKVIVSKTGVKRIYKQGSNKYRIHYDFILTYRKAYELKNFIQTYNNTTFRMTNWKGEIWVVKFATNPFVFTEVAKWGPSCTKTTVSLEFEGVRLN